MSKPLKFFIGLLAALAVGWIAHAPLGRGEAFIGQLEADVQATLAASRLPVTGAMQRDPLARTAILSGSVDGFQRDGIGSLPGLDERVLSIPGMGAVEWTNP